MDWDLGTRAMSSARVVLFVGAFDPMHKAHLQKAAAAARMVRGVCLVMPIREIPEKPWAANISVRMAIIRAQIAGKPSIDVAEESDNLHSENYMHALANRHGMRVFSLLGQDLFNDIKRLACAADILNYTTVIVAERDGVAPREVPDATRGLAEYRRDHTVEPGMELSGRSIAVRHVWTNIAYPQSRLIHAKLGGLSRSSAQLRSSIRAGSEEFRKEFATPHAANLVRAHYARGATE